MGFKYGFFDSLNGDREYSADDFNKIFQGFLPQKGIFEYFNGASDHFNATFSNYQTEKDYAYTSTSYDILISPGAGWILYKWFCNDNSMGKGVSLPNEGNSRKDTLAVHMDADSRTVGLDIYRGSASDFPSLDYSYLPLANITITWVPAATGSPMHWHISIESLVGTSVCPYINTVANPDIEVDSQMSSVSTNPLQNRVITNAINSINNSGLEAIDSTVYLTDLEDGNYQIIDGGYVIFDYPSYHSEIPGIKNGYISKFTSSLNGNKYFIAIGDCWTFGDSPDIIGGQIDNDSVHIRSFIESVDNKLDISGGQMLGVLDMLNNKIINLPTPNDYHEPATKGYVDAHSSSGTSVILYSQTLESDLTEIIINSYNNQPFNCKHFYVQMDIPPASSAVQENINVERSTSGYWQGINMLLAGMKSTTDSSKHTLLFAEYKQYDGIYYTSEYGGAIVATNVKWTNMYNNIQSYKFAGSTSNINQNGTTAIKLSGSFPTGTSINIWGEI